MDWQELTDLTRGQPAGLVTCLVTGVRPVGALRGLGQVLWALPGTRFEIEDGRVAVLVSVR